MNVLGLGGLDHNGAACVLANGEVHAFLELERVTRRKNQGLDTPAAADSLLNAVGFADPDVIAIADVTWCEARSWLPDWCDRRFPGVPRRVFGHHECHLAAAFVSSPYGEATVASIDGKGDGLSATSGLARRGSSPVVTASVPSAHSVGRIWWALCAWLGLSGYHSAGEAMALAAYGEPRYLDALTACWSACEDGGFRFLEPSDPDLFRQVPRLVAWMSTITRTTATTGEPAREHMDMAASVQELTELVVERFVASAVQRSGSRRLCLAGGVALNGLANQRLLERGVVDGLHVPPFTDDRGLAFGAAALGALELGVEIGEFPEGVSPFLGPLPDLAVRPDRGFREAARGGSAVEVVAERVHHGAIVGWFGGRDEAGPRALGNRSILASPASEDMRRRLNAEVKRRQWYRPFGCSVLSSRASEWFECDGASRYMLRIVRVRPERRAAITAVVHHDGTSRIQTVSPGRDFPLARLLEALEVRGHPPLALNTSLNGPGEPIVHTAQQAMDSAAVLGLDGVMIGDVFFERSS